MGFLAPVGNIPEITAQAELIQKILHTSYVDDAGINDFENIREKLRGLMKYIVHKGLMKDLSVLQDAPFTDNGSIVEIFTDLTVWLGIKKVIDRINANAIAA